MVAAVEIVSHAGRPTCFDEASLDIRSYSEDICGGAGVVPGRAWAALMSSLTDSDSFDMSAVCVSERRCGKWLRFFISRQEEFTFLVFFGKLFASPSMFIIYRMFVLPSGHCAD